MITKFSASSIPSYVTVDDMDGQGTPGYLIVIPGFGDQRIFEGDYIVLDYNGVPVRYVSSADYGSDLVLQNIIREEVGKDLIRSIWAALNASNMTSANKAGVTVAITPVMVMILTGEIVSARFQANATTTTASYTAVVKSALLALMDQAIAKL